MSTSRRRGRLGWLLLAAFVVVPLVEIYVIIQVGQLIGPWWTILLLIADSVLGSWLVKREGGRAWQALREALAQHRMPHRELADGVLILVGGLLMVTPGFVLDLLGAVCILPFTRPLGRRALAGLIQRRLVTPTVGSTPGAGRASGTDDPRARRRPGPGDVVQGEVVDRP